MGVSESSYNGEVETVVGAGRVGVVVAKYERQRVYSTEEHDLGVRQRPGDRYVTRAAAGTEMQNLEGRTVHALAGM